jgi:hypothetical protein
LGRLDAAALARVTAELTSLEQTVLGHAPTCGPFSPIPQSRGVARGKSCMTSSSARSTTSTLQVAVYAATNAPAPEVPHALAELAIAARELVTLASSFPLGSLGLLARVGASPDSPTRFWTTSTPQLRRDRRRSLSLGAHHRGQSRTAPSAARPRRRPRIAPRSHRIQALSSGKVNAVTLALARFTSRAAGLATSSARSTTSWTMSPGRAIGASRACTPRDPWTRRARRPRRVAHLAHRQERRTADRRRAPNCSAAFSSRSATFDSTRSTRGRLGALRDAVAPGHLYESALNRNN